MKLVLFAAAVVQLVLVARPVLGAVEYVLSRGSFDAQRLAVTAALMERS